MTEQLVNPTPAQIRDLPRGATFRVEGVLTQNERGTREERSYPGARSTHAVEFAHITITPAKGDPFYFEGKSFPLRYEGGVLENLRNSVAEVGETVSIEVSIIVDGTNVKRPSIGYSHANLLVPSTERQAAYDELRATAAEQLTMLELYVRIAASADDFAVARETFAAIRKLTLTKGERARLLQARRSMPTYERPMYDRYNTTRDAVEKAFGVNIEELNPEDYLTFARRVLFGELPSPDKPNRIDQSHLFRLLEEPPFTTAQFAELVTDTLKTRIARLEQTGDSHDDYWDDYYLIEQCLAYLGTIEGSYGVEALAWMIDYCLTRDYFDNRLSRSENPTVPHKFDSFLEKAVRSLTEGAQYRGVRAPVGFDFGRMLAWSNTLAAYPFMDHAAAQLRQSFTELAKVLRPRSAIHSASLRSASSTPLPATSLAYQLSLLPRRRESTYRSTRFCRVPASMRRRRSPEGAV